MIQLTRKPIQWLALLITSILLVSCSGTTATREGGVVTEAAYLCELAPGITSGIGQPTDLPDQSKLTPFVLTRMSLPDQPNRFGFQSEAGSSVGIGLKQPDGRWLVGRWGARDATGPQFTLMTLFPDNNVLLSHRSGGTSHVTFAGRCEERTNALSEG